MVLTAIMLTQPGEEAMVVRPVGADHVAADEEGDEQRHLVAEEVEQGPGVLLGCRDRLGDADLHHQQGHGNREHRVGEEGHPAEVEVLALAWVAGRGHRRLLWFAWLAGIRPR
jgi:hypothetical protein